MSSTKMWWHVQVIIAECSLVLVLNTSLMVTVVLNKGLRSRLSNLFLLNLFAAHIVESMVGLARSTVLFSEIKVPSKVNLSVNLFTAATLLSYLSNLPVTLDRYVAVLHPFHYQRMNWQHVLVVNSLVWCVSLVFSLFTVFLEMSSRIGDALTFALTVLMCVALVVVNVKIYRVVRQQTTQLKSIQLNSNVNISRNNINEVKPTTQKLCFLSNHTEYAGETYHGQFTRKINKANRKPIVIEKMEDTKEEQTTSNRVTSQNDRQQNNKGGSFPNQANEIGISDQLRNGKVDNNGQATGRSISQDSSNIINPDNKTMSTNNKKESIIERIDTTHSGNAIRMVSNNNYNNNNNRSNNNHSNSNNNNIKKSNNRSLDIRCVRSAKLCAGIVVSFTICWTPHALHDILKITNSAPAIVYSDSVLARCTLVLAFFNGIVDPIIYVLMNRELKGQIQKLYRYVFNKVTPVQE